MKNITNREAIEMMQRCISEFRQLRKTVDTLAPQAEAYNVIRDIVGMLPKRSQGYGEDLIWRLEKAIKELEEQPAAEHPGTM